MNSVVEKSTITPEPERKKTLFRSLIGKSPAMKEVHNEIRQVAASDANVLILGDSGTGKEVVARNIHYFSNRKNKPFVPVNCGAIPHELLESELFGHEKGAFTGAITSRQGRFSMAEGGTLFLDEIGEMTMAMQVKLLRVLEERVFERVGGTTTIHADVRIIAATNRNLEEMVKQGKFREDLYFRLDVFPINLPALRDRIEDLPLLIKELVTRLEITKQCSVRFTQDAVVAMSKYDWPGNVRELANQIERMSIKHPDGLVGESDLPARIRASASSGNKGLEPHEIDDCSVQSYYNRTESTDMPQFNFPAEGFNLKTYMSNIEIKIIQDALDSTGGVIAHAAKTLGLRRTTLAEKMRKHHIDRSPDNSGCNAC
ncbi:MAG TPA: sigma-54-dependent Fis family transcriptional regulator [Gammaproteobacteria bacterium]|nr:sigma-54-dependent Fis family transcriptional regulator [Gammaproteobacteria bacterium]